MIVFDFTHKGIRTLESLSFEVQDRIKKKLFEFKVHPDIFKVIGTLTGFHFASHKIRVGDYRVVLKLKYQSTQDICFWVIKVGHRSKVYGDLT